MEYIYGNFLPLVGSRHFFIMGGTPLDFVQARFWKLKVDTSFFEPFFGLHENFTLSSSRLMMQG